MEFNEKIVDCQNPKNEWNIDRKHALVKFQIIKDSEEYKTLLNKARFLATRVNPATANASEIKREDIRKITDNFGGILAEEGWLQYFNHKFGNIASHKGYTSAFEQIDIVFTNGEYAEIRSSFIDNGVKFGICSAKDNFKNIGPYSNSIKPGEIQKHLYLGVLFETKKELLLTDSNIHFSLIGGSTWSMMIEKGKNSYLKPKDGSIKKGGNYRVLYYKEALDVREIVKAIEELGYEKNLIQRIE